MKNDFLRVNSKTDNDEIVIGEFSSKPIEKENIKEKTVSIFSLFSSNKDNDYVLEITNKKMPSVRSVFTLLIIHSLASLLLCLVAFLTSDISTLMFSAMISSLILPMFMLVFLYQINTENTISFFEIIVGVALGGTTYLILSNLEGYILELITSKWLGDLFATVVKDTVLFLLSYLIVRVTKKNNILEAILVTVCIYVGYVFVYSLDNMISSMLVATEFTHGQVIIMGEEGLRNVQHSFLYSLFDSIYVSCLTSFWGIINGGVIGISIYPIKNEHIKEWSLSSMFLITVVLHVIAVFPSMITIFEIILRVTAFIISLVLAIKMLNYYLSKLKIKKV